MHRYSLIFAAISVYCLFLFFFSAKTHAYLLRNCLTLSLAVAFAALGAATALSSQFLEMLYLCLLLAFLMLLFIAFVLIGSGIAMFFLEAERGRNSITLLLGFFLAGGDCGVFALLRKVFFAHTTDLTVFLIGSAALIYGALLLFSFLSYILLLPLFSRFDSFDAILVHGCALIRGDQISRILAERLETAIRLYHFGADRARIVVSGGRGDDETVTEAEAMCAYFRERDIPEERIILEDRSHSTEENLLFSMELLSGANQSRIALVTSNYHLFRCLLQAHELGIACKGFGAPVAAYYWPNAAIREFAAVFSRKRYLFFFLLGYFAFTGLLLGAHHIFGL